MSILISPLKKTSPTSLITQKMDGSPGESPGFFKRTPKDQEELFAEILELGAPLGPSALKGKLPKESESPELGTAGNLGKLLKEHLEIFVWIDGDVKGDLIQDVGIWVCLKMLG